VRKWLFEKPQGQIRAAYLKAHDFRIAVEYPDQLRRARQAVLRRYGKVVADGPFKGMIYGKEAFCSAYLPKILGCYESEIQPALDLLLEKNPPIILNIGAAEGYYAVGLARRFPQATVYASEIESHARDLCEDLARLNDVSERVRVIGECTLDELNALPLEGGLILCDCEGCELELLQPEIVPGLRTCNLLVELHDCFDPRITPALRQRFESTHDITIIDSVPHDPAQVDTARFLPPPLRQVAVDDGRGEWLQWALMTAKPTQVLADEPEPKS
jgi:hypothetical protein